jgi:short subunit dehydrogenase-like uncharacterized protein
MNKIILYGSYGYTGNIIAEIAAEDNREVLLSGRNAEKLHEQAEKLGLPRMRASLELPGELDALMSPGDVVLHCAGPYVHTWKTMAEACLRNRCHYLDITGEIEVFESLKQKGPEFAEANIMSMPGVGFDVVPTDCMALFLSKQISDPTHLEMALKGLGGGISRGTLKTMIENLGSSGAVRINGRIEKVPVAWRVKDIDFGGKVSRVVTIPWGDVSTAYTTTGIENITLYIALPSKVIRSMKWSRWMAPLLKTSMVKKFLKKRVDRGAPGPAEQKRKESRSIVWGSVRNKMGEEASAIIETKEAYQLTAEMAWHIACRVSDGDFSPGYQTPAGAYGDELIFQIDGTHRVILG